MRRAKPFEISKHAVIDAWHSVKSNHGAHGIDGQTITEFEKDLKNNLYKLWNRLSSGSYFPSAVRAVEIPKRDGKKRLLGIPTVADRVAQTVVRNHFEKLVDPHFHPNSYAYRRGKSALDAIEVTRIRCWQYDWGLELDIKSAFDNKAVNQKLKSGYTGYRNENQMHCSIGKWVLSQQLNNRSRMNREVHVRFYERPRGRFPRSTHLFANESK